MQLSRPIFQWTNLLIHPLHVIDKSTFVRGNTIEPERTHEGLRRDERNDDCLPTAKPPFRFQRCFGSERGPFGGSTMATHKATGNKPRAIVTTIFTRFSGTVLMAFVTMAIALGLATGARAQTDTGRVTGTVTDSSGAVIQGASVTLTSVETAAAQTVTSGSDGNYSFAAITRGNYKISGTASG